MNLKYGYGLSSVLVHHHPLFLAFEPSLICIIYWSLICLVFFLNFYISLMNVVWYFSFISLILSFLMDKRKLME